MRTEGTTIVKAKKSRTHTEIMAKYLNLPLKVNIKKNYDLSNWRHWKYKYKDL